MRGIVAVSAALGVALAAIHARADDNPSNDTPEERKARAKAIWDEGYRRYQLGKWDEAARLFEQAYEVWPFSEILFNLCQAHRQMASYKKAIFYCKAYLREVPNAKGRKDVEELVLDMEKLEAQQRDSNARPPDGVEKPPGPIEPAPSEPRGGRSFGPWKWALLGAGVVAAGVGVTLIAIDEDEFEGGMRNGDFHDTAPAGVALTVAGGALALGGAVLWLLERPAPERRSGVAVTPRADGLYVTYGTSF